MTSTAARQQDQTTAQEQNPAYSIYVFKHGNDNLSPSSCRWEKRDTFPDMGQAMRQAETLFASGQYNKVEVKQKYFDRRIERHIDMTLKVLEKRNTGLPLNSAIAVISLLGGLFAFIAIYLIEIS